jgi:hypothetical protein
MADNHSQSGMEELHIEARVVIEQIYGTSLGFIGRQLARLKRRIWSAENSEQKMEAYWSERGQDGTQMGQTSCWECRRIYANRYMFSKFNCRHHELDAF